MNERSRAELHSEWRKEQLAPVFGFGALVAFAGRLRLRKSQTPPSIDFGGLSSSKSQRGQRVCPARGIVGETGFPPRD